jgi:hypothetical protein
LGPFDATGHSVDPLPEEKADAFAKNFIDIAHLEGGVADEAAGLAAVAVVESGRLREQATDLLAGVAFEAKGVELSLAGFRHLDIQDRQAEGFLAGEMVKEVGLGHLAGTRDLIQGCLVEAVEMDEVLRFEDDGLSDLGVGFSSHFD